MKCTCKWIDKQGNDTPDTNDAIAMAVCYDPISFGEKGSEPFAICEEHASRRTRYWKLLPLPGVAVEQSHELVQRDHRYFPRIITDVVIKALKAAFPSDTHSIRNNILNDVKWDSLNGCYYFQRWGMYVGVEEDGYIHT
jgi:hypothetical protein